MNLYRELILDHYKHPRNVGVLKNPTVTWKEENASCGDSMSISLTINHQSLTIRKLRWQGTGCAISTAAASLLSEKIQGMSVAAIQKLTDRDVTALLGGEISFARMKCAMLPLEALRTALNTL